MKSKFVLIGFLCVLFFLFQNCTKKTHSNKWQGTIEEVDGVTIVKNPEEPIYNKDIFSLEEELTIGEKQGNEDNMFSAVNHLTVDDDERIYVLDYKNVQVKVFDRDGKYLSTFGQRGQGPGEFFRPRGIYITSEDEVMVYDMGNRSFIYFSKEGQFLSSFSTAKLSLMGARIDSKGNIIGDVFSANPEDRSFVLKKFDSKLNELFTIGSSLLSPPGVFKVSLPSCSWQITQDDHIVFGYTKNYEIQIMNPEGEVIRKISKEYDPVEFTDKEKKGYLENNPLKLKIEFPKYHNPFLRFFLDDEGRLFVLTSEKAENKESYYYDIFDPEGKYIAKVLFNINSPLFFKKGKLYTIEEDEDGYQYVKRYKVTWKY